jgi:putative addiction module antidote
MIRLKIEAIGDSVGVVLPEELQKKLGVEAGDTLLALETSNGVELRQCDTELNSQIEIAEGIMRDDYEVLRRLAGRGHLEL